MKRRTRKMNQYNKKRSPIAAVITAILLPVLFISCMMFSTQISRDVKINMFDDITETEVMTAFAVRDLTDENLEGLLPVGSFSKLIEWENKKFEVYACEFHTQNDLDAYLKRLRTYRSDKKQGWHISGNSFSHTDAVFYYDTCVLYIVGPSQVRTMYFAQWLTAAFENRIM